MNNLKRKQKVKTRWLRKQKRGKQCFFWKRGMCDCTKSKFIEKQDAIWLLSSLGIKKPLSKIHLVGSLFF